MSTGPLFSYLTFPTWLFVFDPVNNYFNYFTEIEEHFQRRRGSLSILSPLDWALMRRGRTRAFRWRRCFAASTRP